MNVQQALTEAVRYAEREYDVYTVEVTHWQDGDFRVEAFHSFARNDETYRRRIVMTPHQKNVELVRVVNAGEMTVVESEEL